jgi:hypothetical protein
MPGFGENAIWINAAHDIRLGQAVCYSGMTTPFSLSLSLLPSDIVDFVDNVLAATPGCGLHNVNIVNIVTKKRTVEGDPIVHDRFLL